MHTEDHVTRAPRFSARDALPDVFAALVRASRHPAGPVDDATLELVKVRASQINGCAFCCDLHARRAAAAGVDDLVLRALPGWRDLPGLDPSRRTALEVGEALTRLTPGPELDRILDDALTALGEEGFAQVVAAAAAINAWNRLMVASGAAPNPSFA
jgi:AhpD family alkylhydroperoxidase